CAAGPTVVVSALTHFVTSQPWPDGSLSVTLNVDPGAAPRSTFTVQVTDPPSSATALGPLPSQSLTRPDSSACVIVGANAMAATTAVPMPRISPPIPRRNVRFLLPAIAFLPLVPP